MKTIVRNRLVAASIALGIAALAAPALARGVPGFNARPYNSADSGCFSEWYGSIVNNCASTKQIFLPQTIDTSDQWYNTTVYAYGASPSNNVGCQSIGNNKENTSNWASAQKYLTTFGSTQPITVSSYVPSGGVLFTWCLLNQGGRVAAIHQ